MKLTQFRMPPPAAPPPPKLIGSSLSFSPLTFMLSSALSVLSISAVAITLTVSDVWPISSAISSLTVWSISTSTPTCLTVLNPGADTDTVYLPTGTDVIVKIPVLLVVAL